MKPTFFHKNLMFIAAVFTLIFFHDIRVGAAEEHLIKMRSEIYAGESINAIRDVDYGIFHYLVVSTEEYNRMQAVGAKFSLLEAPYTLRLGEQSFDPLYDRPAVPEEWKVVRRKGPDFRLIQFTGPVKSEWIKSLKANNIEVVQYISPFTYIVWSEPLDDKKVAGISEYIRWTGEFYPAYRVLPHWRHLSEALVEIDVLLYRGADTDGAIKRIEALGGRSLGWGALNDVFEIAGFVIPGDRLRSASEISGVYSIQLRPKTGGLRSEMSNQVNAGNVDGANIAYPGYMSWLSGLGLDGSGIVIANVDSGIQETHVDLVNRMISCSGDTCGGSASSSHGTHTAGIMAADGSSGTTDSYGFLRGLGMAPGAQLVEQVYSPWYEEPNGMLLLMTDSYNNGASLSGNSWGPSGYPEGYDNDTMQVDIGVRDADPDAPGNQPLNYILSFMNGYGGTQSQGTPDEAKNIFNIGSTKMQNYDGSQIPEINDLSSNTAHGPALDGRTIPHMVAPGCYVDSSVPTNSYGLKCGTSMASPHVSGSVALFIEYYRNLFSVDPSPALIKAAFLPVCHDLYGHLDADGGTLEHPFDSKQGWGRMKLEAVLNPSLPPEYFDNPVIFDDTGDYWEQSFNAVAPGQPVRIMLVWTDAPGHGLGGSTPAWNNDLDLIVYYDGNTYYGNNFGADGWSEPGGSPDDKNNTEGVFLETGSAGSYTIRIEAANVNSDGIPNLGDATDQDFSLVAYNAGPAGSPTPLPTATATPTGPTQTPTRTPTETLTPTITPTPEATYCPASGGCYEYISGVEAGTVSNLDTGCDNYYDYTSQFSTDMMIGQNYPITVTNGYAYEGDDCGAWVDWNQDKDFDDPGEFYDLGTGTGPYTGNISPPAGAILGMTRMRVRIQYYSTLSPCGTTMYGEVEDYGINVVDSGGTPSPTHSPSPTPTGSGTPPNGGNTCESAPDITSFLQQAWLQSQSLCLPADNSSMSNYYSSDCGPCGYMGDAQDLVWKFTPPETWYFRINNCDSNHDWSLVVWENECPGVVAACDDDSCNDCSFPFDFDSRCVSFAPGTTYYAVVWPYDGIETTSVCWVPCGSPPTASPTRTPTTTPSPSLTPTAQPTFSPSPTVSPFSTRSPTPLHSSTPAPSPSLSPSPSPTGTIPPVPSLHFTGLLALILLLASALHISLLKIR